MTKVKICGIADIGYVDTSAEAGADLIGVVFAPSPRQVNAQKAREIATAAGEHNLPVIGVFVNTDADTVNLLADFCGLDRVQLSGGETFDYCKYIKKPIIKAVHVSSKWTEDKLISHLEEGKRTLGTQELTYLLDTYEEQKYGGTGKTFSWEIAKKVTTAFPIIIAGGLDPDNVGRVVGDLKPWGVDVSSGVETNGVKDKNKIKAFIKAVRSIK